MFSPVLLLQSTAEADSLQRIHEPIALFCFGISSLARIVGALAQTEEDGMSFRRRQFLQALSYAVGSSFMLSQIGSAMTTESAAQSANSAAPAKAATKHESGETEMEKVAGIGGLFFRAHDPKSLGAWYQQHLGIALTPSSEGGTVWQQEAGPTSFTPFPETTKYFGDPQKAWMINFRVHDIDKMVSQLRTAGIDVKDPETYPNIGRFTRIHDPEGNPIELWQPA